MPLESEVAGESSQMSSPTTSQIPGTSSTIDRKRAEKERKIGHRRVDQQGLVTYKKIGTSTICGSIQLGIAYSVGSLASKPERDVLMQDFTIVETNVFTKEGSKFTPAHTYTDFRFRTYAPLAFRYFRDLFGIQPDDFLSSLSAEPLVELNNPGASGSVFYITYDDEFIIKTVQHKEAEFLQKLLPGYYMNLNQNPRTLLPKFFGLFCYICGGKNVRTCVMNNLLPTSIKIHQKYDLKGSTYKRKANKYERMKESPTYKDLDFTEHNPEGILLESETYTALVKTIQRDCRVLESFKIMDYSMLVGIHNLDQAYKERQDKHEKLARERMAAVAAEAAAEANKRGLLAENDYDYEDKRKPGVGLTRSKSLNKQKLTAFSTAMESIQAEVEPIDEEDDVPPGGIPARNAKGERLLLFLGIIDILQSYRLKKKLEHTWKSILHDGDSISVHRPAFYSQRFQDFMAEKVFKKIPSPLKHSPSKRKTGGLRIKPTSAIDSTDSKQNFLKSSSSAETTLDVPSTATTTITSASQFVQHTVMTNAIAPTSSPILHPKSRSNADSAPSLRTVVIKQAASKQSVAIAEKIDSVSVSQINFHTDTISSSSSGNSSGFGTLRAVTWTPPHSVEGSTPTHTEGTPSLTESSESGDIACPTTPNRSSRRSHTSSQCSDGGDAFGDIIVTKL